MSEHGYNAYTEIDIIGKAEDIIYLVDWLGNVYEGDLRFDEAAIVALAMDTPEFRPIWSGVEPIEGGTKIWFTNFSGISELIITSMHTYLLDKLDVFAEFKCLRASFESFGTYILDGEDLHYVAVSADVDGREEFNLRVKKVFGDDWLELSDGSYCYHRLEKEAENYRED